MSNEPDFGIWPDDYTPTGRPLESTQIVIVEKAKYDALVAERDQLRSQLAEAQEWETIHYSSKNVRVQQRRTASEGGNDE